MLQTEELHDCWCVTSVSPCGYLNAMQVVETTRGRYHGGRRPSSDDSPTVIQPSALDGPSIVKRYHRRRTCSHTSPRRSPIMVTLTDTRFVECRWWNDGWTVKTVVTWRSSASIIRPQVDWQEDLVCTRSCSGTVANRYSSNVWVVIVATVTVMRVVPVVVIACCSDLQASGPFKIHVHQ